MAAACGPNLSGDVVWAGWIALAGTRGQEAGRAEITGSREGAKPRSSDEKRTFFPKSPRPRQWIRFSAKAIRCHIRRPPRRARLPGKRSGSGGRSGLRARRACLWQGQFSGRRIFGNSGRLLIILADNYNQTTNDPTTETQSARRTHRDFLAERSDAVSIFAILAFYRKQRPAAAGPCCSSLGSRLHSWPTLAGWAVRACSVVVWAGWLSWQAFGQGGRRPVGPESKVCWPSVEAVFRGAGFGKQCLRFAITISG